MNQTTMSIRIDNNLKRNFDALCEDFGLSSSAAVTVFIKAVVREKRIPIEIKVEQPSNNIRQQALSAFLRMREDAKQAGLQDLTLEDINAIIKETRDERE